MSREAKIRLVEAVLDPAGVNRVAGLKQRRSAKRRLATPALPLWQTRLQQMFQGMLTSRV